MAHRVSSLLLAAVLLSSCGDPGNGTDESTAAGDTPVQDAATGASSEGAADAGAGGVAVAPESCIQFSGPSAVEFGLDQPPSQMHPDNDPASIPDKVDCVWETEGTDGVRRILVSVELDYWPDEVTASERMQSDLVFAESGVDIDPIDLSHIADEGVSSRRYTGPGPATWSRGRPCS